MVKGKSRVDTTAHSRATHTTTSFQLRSQAGEWVSYEEEAAQEESEQNMKHKFT